MALLKEILKCQQEIKLTQEINLLLPLKSLEAVEVLEVKLRDSDIFKTVVCRMYYIACRVLLTKQNINEKI